MAEIGKRMGLMAALSGAVLMAVGCVVVPTETPGSVSSSTAPPVLQSNTPKTDGGKGESRRSVEPQKTSLQELKEQYGLSGEVVVTFHHIEANPFSAFRSHPVFGI